MSSYDLPIQTSISNSTSPKHSLNGSVAILKQNELTNSESDPIIVIGQEDLNLLYYQHQNQYSSVSQMIETLKQLLKDDDSEREPTLVILDSDKKVQYSSD